MTDSTKTPPDADAPKRRLNDVPTRDPALEAAADDPELLYKELRAGKRSIQSLAALLPLNVAFQWQAQRRISDQEFGLLMAGLDILQVDIGEMPTQKANEPDPDQQRTAAVIAAFKARMANFDTISLVPEITELEMKPVFQTKTPLVDGIGFRLGFAAGQEDAPAKPGTPPALTVLGRAYIASTSLRSAVKCEALFSAVGMEHEIHCRVVVPLPLQKGGRRRLLVSVLDNETRQPVQLPAAVAELFHEKNLFDIRLLKKGDGPGSDLGSALVGAFGKLFHR